MLKLNSRSCRFARIRSIALVIPFFFFIGFSTPLSIAQEVAGSGLVPLPINIQPVPMQEALINVFVDGREYWDVNANLDAEAPFLKISLLKELLEPSLALEPFNDVFGIVLSLLEWAGPADLNAAGIDTSWDMSTLTYEISTPPSLAKLRQLDFSPPVIIKGKEVFNPSLFSTVINLSTSSDGTFGGTPSFSQNLDIDALIKIWDIALEAGAVFYWPLSGQVSITLGKARAVYDIPSLGGRLLAGKVTAGGASFQSASEILGISISSIDQFSRYDRKASPSIAFTLDKLSTVKVMVNGLPVRGMRLDRGKYRIYDLPFSSGLNTLEIYVSDDTGIEKLLRPSEAYIAAEGGILVSGQLEYEFSAGVGSSVPYEPFSSLNIIYGLDYRVTVSAFAEVDASSVLGGCTVIGGTSLGIISAEAASVMAWDGRAMPFSYAANLRYQVNIPARPRFPNISVTTEYISKGFSPPQTSTEAIVVNDPRINIVGSIGGSMSRALSYNATISWARTFGLPIVDSFSVNLNLGYLSSNGVSVSANSGLTLRSGGQLNPSITLSIYARPQGRPNASLSFAQSADGQSSLSYSDRLNMLGGIDASMQAYNLLLGSPGNKILNTSLKKQTSIGNLNLDGGFTFFESSGKIDGSISLKTGTAVVYTQGIFALSKPQNDSFVILLPDASVGNNKVTLTTTSAGTITARNMPAVLSLSSYQQTLAHADLPDSDANTVASVPESVLSPKYRSGFVYSVGIKKQYYLLGRLVNEAGKPYAYIAGDVYDPEGNQLESIFTYEDGTFQLLATSLGNYRIEWPIGIGISYITIPEGVEETIELGDIFAEAGKEQ